MSTLRPMTSPTAVPAGDLERLRGQSGGTVEQEKARLRMAAKEFESLFMYQMLKTMRQTVGESTLAEGSPMSGTLGKDTFMDMFDVQIAREMATGGNGSVADILYRALERTIEPESDEPVTIKPLKIMSQAREPMKISRPEFPVGCSGSRPVKITQKAVDALPLRETSEPVVQPTARVSPGTVKKTPDVRTALPSLSATGRIVPRPVRVEQPAARIAEPEKLAYADDPILRKFGSLIDEAAATHQVDSSLISAVIRAESGGNPRAESPAGAKGLMQLMDGTAADLGVEDAFDVRENIMSGTRYLRQLIDRFGDLKLALAAYNAGPGAVERHSGIPPYAETRAYVQKVLTNAADYRDGEGRASAKGLSDANR